MGEVTLMTPTKAKVYRTILPCLYDLVPKQCSMHGLTLDGTTLVSLRVLDRERSLKDMHSYKHL